MIKDVTLSATTEFKVIDINSDPLAWYPAGENNNYVIPADGKYDIYFRPNANGGDDWHEGCIYATPAESTGINGVNTTANNAVIFNMAGQRVMNAKKGLFIINGKKVVK